MEEVPHKRYLNDYFCGKIAGSVSRGELYNDDPVTMDARFCATTASMCGIESAGFEQNEEKLAAAVRMDIMLHAYMLTQSGIPMLYSGDEIAQVNDYTYKENPAKAVDSRYIHRGAFNWENAARRGDGDTVEGQVFQALNKLERIRREEKIFEAGASVYTYDVKNDSILGIIRMREDDVFIGLFNFSEESQTAWMEEKGIWHDLMNDSTIELHNPELAGHDFIWCKLTDAGQ